MEILVQSAAVYALASLVMAISAVIQAEGTSFTATVYVFQNYASMLVSVIGVCIGTIPFYVLKGFAYCKT